MSEYGKYAEFYKNALSHSLRTSINTGPPTAAAAADGRATEGNFAKKSRRSA